jgi:uncharacterized protein
LESTETTPKPWETRHDWKSSGLSYYKYNFFLQSVFGARVQRVSIDAGFTCPNVDGTVAVGGCTFCDNRSFSPSRRLPRQFILDQIQEGISRLKRRYKCDQFIAYFQPATNTFAPIDQLRELYDQALSHPKIIGLAIGTRPDCVPEDVLNLLSEYAQHHYVTVEYGMQTMHDRSLEWMNRGHFHDVTVDAIERSKGRGFEIGLHIMLGLPGETYADMMETANEVARLNCESVKLHNLYAVKNTPLADQVNRGEVQLIDRDTYIRTVVDFIEVLPPTMIIERISGESPGEYFLGPSWCLDKPAILNALAWEFENRPTWQGKLYQKSVNAIAGSGSR